MKIIKNDKISKSFGRINEGEVFEHDGEIYMKINEIMTFGGDTLNAINLETTNLVYVPYADLVMPLPEAKLTY